MASLKMRVCWLMMNSCFETFTPARLTLYADGDKGVVESMPFRLAIT